MKVFHKVECVCEEWRIGSEQIDNAQFFAFVHGIEYSAPYFRFCPWCGLPLEVYEVEVQPHNNALAPEQNPQANLA